MENELLAFEREWILFSYKCFAETQTKGGRDEMDQRNSYHHVLVMFLGSGDFS